jgi:Asp-tRNA(Asn)/Glu-tRNA(Gln) amidotransferase A subunit family amidase
MTLAGAARVPAPGSQPAQLRIAPVRALFDTVIDRGARARWAARAEARVCCDESSTDGRIEPEVSELMERAIEDLRKQGFDVLDDFEIPDLWSWLRSSLVCPRLKFDLNNYLSELGPNAPIRDFESLIKTRRYHPFIGVRLVHEQRFPAPEEWDRCKEVVQRREQLRRHLLAAMDAADVDILIYPTWNFRPARLGMQSALGNNSPLLAPVVGFPALTVPMGFTSDGLPSGLQMMGRPWTSELLMDVASRFEAATRHRRPPSTTPAL